MVTWALSGGPYWRLSVSDQPLGVPGGLPSRLLGELQTHVWAALVFLNHLKTNSFPNISEYGSLLQCFLEDLWPPWTAPVCALGRCGGSPGGLTASQGCPVQSNDLTWLLGSGPFGPDPGKILERVRGQVKCRPLRICLKF